MPFHGQGCNGKQHLLLPDLRPSRSRNRYIWRAGNPLGQSLWLCQLVPRFVAYATSLPGRGESVEGRALTPSVTSGDSSLSEGALSCGGKLCRTAKRPHPRGGYHGAAVTGGVPFLATGIACLAECMNAFTTPLPVAQRPPIGGGQKCGEEIFTPNGVNLQHFCPEPAPLGSSRASSP